MTTTPAVLMSEIEAKLEALDLPDTISEVDRLTAVYTLEDWLAAEYDRRFLVLPTAGPTRSQGRARCSDTMTFQIRVRYFADKESRGRMVNDVSHIRETLKSTAGLTEVSLSTVGQPQYDYAQWVGMNAIGVRFDVTYEYHAVNGVPL